MKEVASQPDIMGDLREDIENFYKRDHVEVVEETEMVEHIFFTDLNFSHNTRVSQVRWHPTIEGNWLQKKSKLRTLRFLL